MENEIEVNNGLPLVTIIVPAYNHAKYVGETIESIMKQTYPNIEFIIINDGSSDNTDEVIHNYLKKYNNAFKYISKQNEGVCKTVNLGISLAKGTYISFIASDDVMLPSKIEEQIKVFQRNTNVKLALVYSDSYSSTEDGKIIGKLSDQKNFKSNDFFMDLLKGLVFIPPLTCMYTKKALNEVGNFDENLKYEDFDMFLKLSLKYDFKFLDLPLAISRYVPGSLGKNILEKDMLFLSNKYVEMIENKKEKKIVWGYRYKIIGFYFLDHCYMQKGLKYIIKSLITQFSLYVLFQIIFKFVRCTFIKLLGNNNFQLIRNKVKDFNYRRKKK